MAEYTPPCDRCSGSCCRYVAIEIGRPRSKGDYDYIRWYLLHKNVNVFIDHERKWFVEFRTPCEEQREDGLCDIYDERPKICRDYGNTDGECEYHDSPFREYFSTEKEFIRYLEVHGKDWKFRR